MEKKFLNVHSKKDIVLIVSLIIAGAICLLLPLGSYAHIISFLLITLGVFLAFVMKSEYLCEKIFRRFWHAYYQ